MTVSSNIEINAWTATGLDQQPYRQQISRPFSNILSTTFKVASAFAVHASIDLAFICTSGRAIDLYIAKIINFKSLLWLNNFKLNYDLSITNQLMRSIGVLSMKLSVVPIEIIDEALKCIIPKISIFEKKFTHDLTHAFAEELVFRYLLQRTILPAISKRLPERCGKILNHKITRVAITSILFALAHTSVFDQKVGVMPHFIGGLIYGALAEMDQNILASGLTHSFSNFATHFI